MRVAAFAVLSLAVACRSESTAPERAPSSSSTGATSVSAPVPSASTPRKDAGDAEAPATRFALMHVTVIDVASGSEQTDRAVVVDGDRIVAVVPSAELPASPPARAIEAKGKWVIPGLWDMHVHMAEPTAGKLFIANGVTGVRVMWGNPPFQGRVNRYHFDLRDAFEAKREVGPRMVIASQMDGPKPIWPNSVALHSPAEAVKAVDDAKASGVDFIKVYSRLPRDLFLAIAAESKKAGLTFAGHVPDSVSVLEASLAGQKSIEHLTGMLVACSSREEELRKKEWELMTKELPPEERGKRRREQAAAAIASQDPARAEALFAKLRANGTWQCPTLTVLTTMASLDDPSKAADPRLAYVSSFMKDFWDPKTDFRTKNRTPADYASLRAVVAKQMELVGAMQKAGVPILAGTDEANPYCFAGFGLHDELALLVKAGLTPLEALRAATSSPARYFGWEEKLGAVAPEMEADLVVLDADPLADIANTRKIASVVSRGTLYDRAALDALLAETKEAVAHPRWKP